MFFRMWIFLWIIIVLHEIRLLLYVDSNIWKCEQITLLMVMFTFISSVPLESVDNEILILCCQRCCILTWIDINCAFESSGLNAQSSLLVASSSNVLFLSGDACLLAFFSFLGLRTDLEECLRGFLSALDSPSAIQFRGKVLLLVSRIEHTLP